MARRHDDPEEPIDGSEAEVGQALERAHELMGRGGRDALEILKATENAHPDSSRTLEIYSAITRIYETLNNEHGVLLYSWKTFRNAKNVEEAAVTVDQLAPLDAKPLGEFCHEKGEYAMEAGDVRLALLYYSVAEKRGHADAYTYIHMAHCFEAMKMPSAARECYKKSKAISRESPKKIAEGSRRDLMAALNLGFDRTLPPEMEWRQ